MCRRWSWRATALAQGMATAELVVTAGLAASKGEATRLIKQGGLYVNDQRVTDERGRVTLEHAIDGQRDRAAQGPARAAARAGGVIVDESRLNLRESLHDEPVDIGRRGP